MSYPCVYVEWAFEQGKASGREGKIAERSLMQFGLSMAADIDTERNTKNWLNGFDEGLKERNSVPDGMSQETITSYWEK